jgi:hypothetical protein
MTAAFENALERLNVTDREAAMATLVAQKTIELAPKPGSHANDLLSVRITTLGPHEGARLRKQSGEAALPRP